jgi:glutathione S-transferase
MPMIDYRPLEEIISAKGLRIVLVKGYPSPWGQAAKAMFEYKGLDFLVAPQEAGGTNDALVAWSGENSGPVVAWNDEKPISRWLDILMLIERLAPTPSLIPADAAERALMIGLSNELCGELGLGWNRRLQMFAPAMDSGSPPEGVARMGNKYGYRVEDVAAANARLVAQLRALAAQLRTQVGQGRPFFIGNQLSALDFYWVAFMNLIQLPPQEECEVPDHLRQMINSSDAAVLAALDPLLLSHRDRVFKSCFKSPWEL